jgi:prepilin-type N-terminal cleavage/methylation domain-containing protein
MVKKQGFFGKMLYYVAINMRLNRPTNKGFTLLELLIVIAIIGILSQIVYTSLVSARISANEAKTKQMLSSIRTKAEDYYSNSGYSNYGRSYMKMSSSCQGFVSAGGNGLFSTSTGVGLQLQDMFKLATDPVNDIKCLAGNSVSEWSFVGGGAYGASSWAVAVKSIKNPANTFCVDFTGVFKEIPNTTPLAAIYQSGLDGQPYAPAISTNPQNDARCI